MTDYDEDPTASCPAIGELSVPTASSALLIAIHSATPVFILGRNGSGKSALVHYLVRQIGYRSIYIPGSRPSYFENESLQLTPASRHQLETNLRNWDTNLQTRWRAISGTQRNEKAIHDLWTAEVQSKLDAANDITKQGAASPYIQRLQSSSSPLDRVNNLLAQANLPVSIVIQDGELRAKRGSTIYSIAKMSDGERSALIIAAEVVAAKAGSIFFIDEPELHLHRAIVIPLLAALLAERPNCGFVVSTHELDLAASSQQSTIALVRDLVWHGDEPRYWDVDLLAHGDDLPEDLRVDIIGSRRRVLFVEGTTHSLDQPIYSLLFPTVSVRSKENCREVARAVAGLRGTNELHRVEVFGIVDGDGVSSGVGIASQVDGLFPLEGYSIESLYYCEEVLRDVAMRQAGTLGVDVDALLGAARSSALTGLARQGAKEHLAAKVAEKRMREILLSHVPGRDQMAAGERINFQIENPYQAELERICGLVASSDLNSIIKRYPVRESDILSNLAKGLRLSSRQDYELAALACIRASDGLKIALREKLGRVSVELLR